MTKTEYIEKTRKEFSEVYSDNFPVYVEDETETFIAMMIYRNGMRFLYIIDMTSPYRQMNLESMNKDEAVVYCDAINTKVFNRPAPKLNDPRVDKLESFFDDYNAFCDHSEGEIRKYLLNSGTLRFPALEDRNYRIHSVCDRYCSVKGAYMNEASGIVILVSPNDDTTREATFDDIKSNPTLLHDFMLEFYRVTE